MLDGSLRFLTTIRERAREQLESLHWSIKRFANPHAYPCGLDADLHRIKREMIRARRHDD